MRLRIQIILLAMTFSLSPITSAEIYEWIDEAGIKQYSQTPPTDTDSRTYTPSDTGTLSVSGNEKAVVNPPAETPVEEDITRVKQELAKEKERMQLNCEVAQHNLKILSTVGSGKFKDEDGNIVQLTAEDQAKRKANAESQIAANCD